jgi:hypothetical protein
MSKPRSHRAIDKIKKENQLIVQLFQMIVQTRKWWLLPILAVLALLSLLAALTGSSSVLPAIYALF